MEESTEKIRVCLSFCRLKTHPAFTPRFLLNLRIIFCLGNEIISLTCFVSRPLPTVDPKLVPKTTKLVFKGNSFCCRASFFAKIAN